MNTPDIYTTLVSKCADRPRNLHYLKRYMNFITACSSVEYSGYTEGHHILPKAFWPEFENTSKHPWNIAKLTARQHYIAHHMLARAFGGAMWHGFNAMVHIIRDGREYSVTSRIYAELKLNRSALIGGSNAASYDHRLFTFKNKDTDEVRTCTRYDLRMYDTNLTIEDVRCLVIRITKATKGWELWYDDLKCWSSDTYMQVSGLNASSADQTVYKFKNPKSGIVLECTRVELVEASELTTAEVGRICRRGSKKVKGWGMWYDDQECWSFDTCKPKSGLDSTSFDKTMFTFKHLKTDTIKNCTRVELMLFDPSLTHYNMWALISKKQPITKGWVVV